MDIVREELIAAYVHLLKDNEAEVRTAAATQVPGMEVCCESFSWQTIAYKGLILDSHSGFCAIIDLDSNLREIMPCVKDLVTDASQYVRGALATQISGLAPLLGKEK